MFSISWIWLTIFSCSVIVRRISAWLTFSDRAIPSMRFNKAPAFSSPSTVASAACWLFKNREVFSRFFTLSSSIARLIRVKYEPKPTTALPISCNTSDAISNLPWATALSRLACCMAFSSRYLLVWSSKPTIMQSSNILLTLNWICFSTWSLGGGSLNLCNSL
ncbi:hypothetical protein D3C86_1460990 [compost metagenome]